MTYDNEEEEVVETEEAVETLTKLGYMCTICHDMFAEAELKGNLDDCPTCKETNCITER